MKNYPNFDPKVSKLDLKVDLKGQKLDFSAFQLSGVGWICAQKKKPGPLLKNSYILQ